MSASTRPTLVAAAGELDRQVGRDRALAHAPLSGGDGDHVLHAGQQLAGVQRPLLLRKGHHLHVGGDGRPEAGAELFQAANSTASRIR